jgi:hypothetical protein
VEPKRICTTWPPLRGVFTISGWRINSCRMFCTADWTTWTSKWRNSCVSTVTTDRFAPTQIQIPASGWRLVLSREWESILNWEILIRNCSNCYIQAWVIRILGQSQFQDWENHYYVDQQLLTNSVKWILQFQRRDGSFGETENYISPLDRRLLVFIIEVYHIFIFEIQ